MKSLTRYLTFTIPTRMDFVNITPEVAEAVRESGVREGLVLVNAMHITASVFINDDESGLHQDYKTWLEQLAPFDASRFDASSLEAGLGGVCRPHLIPVQRRPLALDLARSLGSRLPLFLVDRLVGL